MVYTPEERKERRRIANAKYRASKGCMVGVGGGRRPSYEKTTMRQIGDVFVQSSKPVFIPKSSKRLTKDSKIEDIVEWCMEVAESLKECPNPAAWGSALTSVLKLIQILEAQLPPPIQEVQPRPRVAIVIEENEGEE